MTKIYFVIPVYKVEEYLGRCVDSVLNQTYPDVHIVLVDDGSPDRCGEICDEYASKYDNITVIHKQNGGLSDARNKGILYVRENADKDDYLTFLDSDDFVHRDFAKIMTGLMEDNDCNISQCGYEKGDKDVFSEQICQKNISVVDSDTALLEYRIKSQSCAKVYKVWTFEGISFPMGRYNEDEFVTYKAVFNARKMVFTDENLYYYYQHNTSIMDNIAKRLKNNPRRHDFLKAYEERIHFFEERNLPYQIMKAKEKICTDIILRYCEQMYLKKAERDEDCTNGTYIRIYKENYTQMINRPGMPLKRRLMYIAFRIMPYSAVVMGKVFTLRK